MPILHLKNKITRSMITTVEKALAVGAIPDCFTLTPKEGFLFLKEVQELENVAAHFKFKQGEKIGPEEPRIEFLLKKTDEETRKMILNRWYQELYTVSYIHVISKINPSPEAQALTKDETTNLMIPVKIVNEVKTKEEKDSSPT